MVYSSVLAKEPSVTGHELESTKPKSPDNQEYNNRGSVRCAHSMSAPRVNPKKRCPSTGYTVLCTKDKIYHAFVVRMAVKHMDSPWELMPETAESDVRETEMASKKVKKRSPGKVTNDDREPAAQPAGWLSAAISTGKLGVAADDSDDDDGRTGEDGRSMKMVSSSTQWEDGETEDRTRVPASTLPPWAARWTPPSPDPPPEVEETPTVESEVKPKPSGLDWIKNEMPCTPAETSKGMHYTRRLQRPCFELDGRALREVYYRSDVAQSTFGMVGPLARWLRAKGTKCMRHFLHSVLNRTSRFVMLKDFLPS